MKKEKIEIITLDNINTWLESNIDISNRTVYIGSIGTVGSSEESGVDTFLAESVIKAIHILENISHDPIIFIMNNPGGDWYHGMAIWDAIKSTPCFTIMKAYGHAMSMGSIIMQAVDWRIMMPNAKMMIHYGSDGYYGHAKTGEKWANESKRIAHQMENIYLESVLCHEQEIGKDNLQTMFTEIVNYHRSFEYPTPTPVEFTFSDDDEIRIEEYRKIIKEMLNADTILTAQETIALGLADEIFEYPVKKWDDLEELTQATNQKNKK
jgi:ATP-dependent protease ClpP protease subunit